ncbi:MAG: hypothetical protein ACRBBN_05035 [Methyloligellaceae bacterium]
MSIISPQTRARINEHIEHKTGTDRNGDGIVGNKGSALRGYYRNPAAHTVHPGVANAEVAMNYDLNGDNFIGNPHGVAAAHRPAHVHSHLGRVHSHPGYVRHPGAMGFVRHCSHMCGGFIRHCGLMCGGAMRHCANFCGNIFRAGAQMAFAPIHAGINLCKGAIHGCIGAVKSCFKGVKDFCKKLF